MVLPLPMRMGSLEEFVLSTRARVKHGDAKLLLIDDQFAAFYASIEGDAPIESMSAVLPGAPWLPSGDALELPTPDPDRLVILQYTSGSTSEPKGVMIPDRVLSANIDACCQAGSMTSDEVMVSWLPLYHDMGLVGFCMLPMSTGVDLVIASPQDFLGAPVRWLEWLSAYRGTATAGPNFSWVLATRALRATSGLDLSALRIALNGAEPVDPDAVERFVEAGARHGLSGSAVFPAFGMAEATLAVTFPEPGSGLTVDVIDGRVLENENYAAPVAPEHGSARRLARLGRPVPGLSVRVCDPGTERMMRDREVGEIEITGTSVTPGYYGRPDATAAAFHDGWLRTGDLGYLVDGELVVCGRIKDVIILGGRNVHPQDVERAIADVDGVRAGNVIAFGTPGRRGRESLVVVAEARDVDDQNDVRRAVAERVRDVVGLPAEDVVLVQPGTLPKTSSGKLQRGLCRERYLESAYTIGQG
jgi:fatty-acyl-CoA synthase